jgi:molybdopterin converting factor small subunit
MTVTVRLFATFRDCLPPHAWGSGVPVAMQEHDSVQALMQAVGVPDDLPRIVLVNGQQATEDWVLREGDLVSVFPPLIGGRGVPEPPL